MKCLKGKRSERRGDNNSYTKIILTFFLLIPSVSGVVDIGEITENIEGVIISLEKDVSSFLELDDTPSTYSGSSGLCPTVNPGENALIFANCTSGGGSGTDTQKTTNGYFLYNDTTTIFFNGTQLNDTIDQITASTTYFPDNASVHGGTWDSGNYTDLWSSGGINSNITISEVGGTPASTITINFSNVIDFNSIVLREWYAGGSGHEIAIGLYDYGTNSYEEEYGDITDMDEFAFTIVNVLDPDDHISGGIVSLQLRHEQAGNPNHILYLDYATLVDGFSTIITTEHDSLSGRDDLENHPWAMDTNASRNFSGNVEGDSGVNATFKWFFGMFNFTTLTDWLGFNGTTVSFNDTKLNDTISSVGVSLGFNDTSGNSSWNQSHASGLYQPLENQRLSTSDEVSFSNISMNDSLITGGVSRIKMTDAQIDIFTDELYAHLSGYPSTDDLYQWGNAQFRWSVVGVNMLVANEIGNLTNVLSNLTVSNIHGGSDIRIHDNLNGSGSNATFEYFFGDGSQLTGISGDNTSWNQSYADLRYANITFSYNQTDGNGNLSWNQSYADLRYANITWSYNQSDRNNPFDQVLNTTNDVTFNQVSLENLIVGTSVRYNGVNVLGDIGGVSGSITGDGESGDFWWRLGDWTGGVGQEYLSFNQSDRLFTLFNTNLSIDSLPSCDADNEKLETDVTGRVFCGVNPSSEHDGNASSICSGTTTYLDGEGNCDDLDNAYAGIEWDYNQTDGNGNLSWNQSYADLRYANITFGYNMTDGVGEGNASWNQSYADLRYCNITWSYNQTQGANTTMYNVYGDFWVNHTLDVFNNWGEWFYNQTDGNGNLSWNQSYADLRYANITWSYNQSDRNNPFDQSLNTTDNVTFAEIVTTEINITSETAPITNITSTGGDSWIFINNTDIILCAGC